MLHKKQVLRAVYFAQRWRLKRLLQIPDKPRAPVLNSPTGAALERHLRICTLLAGNLKDLDLSQGGVACEVGSGDCLASADLFLGAGFNKVYLVEKQAIVVDQRQRDVLRALADRPELPNAMQAMVDSDLPAINAEKVQVIPAFFEEAEVPEKVDFIFSFDVVEHVEDLDGFFKKCADILSPNGVMLHKFDLSGHEFFEDPMPPLDFQTYPDWLYRLMFPKYRRACRRFLDEIVAAMGKAGFELTNQEVLRAAEADYIKMLHPSLCSKARKRSLDQLAPLDVVATLKLAPKRGY